MAYDANSFDPNDPKNQGANPTQNLGPQGGIVQGQVGPSGGSATNPQAASSPTASGMNFTGLNQYLNANQNSGATMGNDIAGKVNQGTMAAANQAQNVYGQFGNDLSQSTAFSDPNAVSQFIANPTGADPSLSQKTQSTLKGAANYQAPIFNKEAGYNTAATGVQNAQDQAGQLQNSQGQFQLLNQYFGNPSYTQGQKNLDQALIGTSSGAQQAFNQAMQNAQNLGTQWNGYNTQAAGAAQNAAQSVNQNAKNAYQDILGAANTNLQNYNNTLAQDNAAQTQAYQTDVNLLNSMNPTHNPLIHGGGANTGTNSNPLTRSQVNGNPQLSQLLSSLGISPVTDSHMAPGTQQAYTGYFGVNPSSFLSASPQLSLNQVVTPQQQAQVNALQQMIGQAPQFGAGDASAKQYDASALPGSFDSAAYNGAVQQKMGSFDQGLAPLQTAINNIQPWHPGQLGGPQDAINSNSKAYQNLNDYLTSYGVNSVANPWASS